MNKLILTPEKKKVSEFKTEYNKYKFLQNISGKKLNPIYSNSMKSIFDYTQIGYNKQNKKNIVKNSLFIKKYLSCDTSVNKTKINFYSIESKNSHLFDSIHTHKKSSSFFSIPKQNVKLLKTKNLSQDLESIFSSVEHNTCNLKNLHNQRLDFNKTLHLISPNKKSSTCSKESNPVFKSQTQLNNYLVRNFNIGSIEYQKLSTKKKVEISKDFFEEKTRKSLNGITEYNTVFKNIKSNHQIQFRDYIDQIAPETKEVDNTQSDFINSVKNMIITRNIDKEKLKTGLKYESRMKNYKLDIEKQLKMSVLASKFLPPPSFIKSKFKNSTMLKYRASNGSNMGTQSKPI